MPPILRFPDFEQPHVSYTDASEYSVGATSMQVHGTRLHPNAYFRKQMNQAQHNYSGTDKEPLSVVLALKHFHPFICGYHVTVFIDDQPLMGIFRAIIFMDVLHIDCS